MNKKSIYAVAVVSIAALLMGGVALANNNENGTSSIEKKIDKAESKIKSWIENDPEKSLGIGFGTQQESAVIRPDGSFRVTGVTVNSVNVAANTVNVNFYGFNRDVSLAGAEMAGAGKTAITISDIKAGDKLSARGTFNKSTKAITVSKVYNLSSNKAETSKIQSKIDELLQLIEKLKAQLKSATGL